MKKIGSLLAVGIFAVSATFSQVKAEETNKYGMNADMQPYIEAASPIVRELIENPNKVLSEDEKKQLKMEYSKIMSKFEGKNPNTRYWGQDLTPAEEKLADDNPGHYAKMLLCADAAMSITESRYGQGHNDWRDAFRHAAWNAFMSRDIGTSWAKLWGDAHENFKGNPADEKEMDLYNNAQGRTLSHLGHDANNTYLANKAKSLVDNHKLKRIKPSVGMTP